MQQALIVDCLLCLEAWFTIAKRCQRVEQLMSNKLDFSVVVVVVQLQLFFYRGGTLDWMTDAGADAFHTLYGSQDANIRAHEMREVQQSVESCSKAARLCAGRDLEFVGGIINRALTEGFNRIASAVLEQHKGRLNKEGNNLLMLATMQKMTLVVKEMVYMGGVDIEQRNEAGDTAIVIACKEVCTLCSDPTAFRPYGSFYLCLALYVRSTPIVVCRVHALITHVCE
jgi:hypothetical protein